MDDRMYQLLHAASRLSHVSVAIISGRDIEDLYQRTLGLEVFRIGSHGADCTSPGGRLLWGTEASLLLVDESLSENLAAAGFKIERKKLSIAVHFRNIDVLRRKDLLERFCEWAREHGLELVAGRCVLEARIPAGDKLSSLRRLMSYTGAKRVLYAGDDLTDFAALSWAAKHGVGLFVQSVEREPPPDPSVVHIADVGALIDEIRYEIDGTPSSRGEARATL